MPASSARAVTATVLAALALAGCADAGAGGRGSAAPVSAAEYRAAVTSFLDCMRRHGYLVSGPVVSPLDQRLLLRDVVPPHDGRPAEFNARLAACDHDADLGDIEPAYLSTHPGKLDPRLRDDAVECLRRQGIKARGDETDYGDYHGQARAGTEFNDCLTAAAKATFPDLPGAITIFY
ncbi:MULTISPECIES: hypothetical protein [Amycolatopsis]|uniref:Lipoprotein n=1 Tax=Amycolatopsis bullii TaxID=941987 RepID=A0ABQ3KIS9_9PSEU|nr:hypothetical protein [Amycolatopsis bullii]GHG29847.1 hypothetical protein GCM10017567_56990 [Amycolatopsis bullii]